MKMIFVAGGSYKSFYINCFLKQKKCDILVFNFGIIYDYDICKEVMENGVVTQELLMLAKSLHCLVVAGIYETTGRNKTKKIIVCDGDKINLYPIKLGATIFCGKHNFVVGDEFTNFGKSNKIILSKFRIYPNLNNCSIKKKYIFCDELGTTFVENKKMSRKFNKYSKFILK